MDIKDIVIVGNGGFAKEVEWLLERINQVCEQWNFLGFIDVNTEDERVIGDDSFVIHAERELYVVIAIGNSHVRYSIYQKYRKNENLKFPNLVDPSVILSSRIHMGQGNLICAGSILTVDITIGDFIIINLDCTIGHDVEIESFATIQPSVNVSGNVMIGNRSEVGTGAHIIQGKKIGSGTIIGAGAAVVKDIPDECTAVGVPAKIMKYH